MKYCSVTLARGALCAALLTLDASAALAKSVTVKGEYAIENDDQAAARRAALKDAFRKAVEQVAGVKVQSTTVSAEWEIVKDEIIAKTEGMVTSHKVLSEGPKDGVYEITIQADVAEKPVSDAINQLISLKKNSKIAVLISERMSANQDFQSTLTQRGMTEDLLINIFQERGFPVVDLSGLAGLNLSSGAKDGQLSAADAAAVAERADAQYVILGKVEGRDAGPIMGSQMRSYTMAVSMRIFAASNQEIIATATESGAVPSISPTFPTGALKHYRKNILEKVANQLVTRIAKRWTEEEQTGTTRIQLVVDNVPNFKMMAQVLDVVSKLKGVSKATKRGFKQKQGKIDVEAEIDSEALATLLSGAKVGGFKLEVTEQDEGRIVVSVNK